MKTDKITVADLFEKQRRYLVPLFQRGYVWTLTGQIRPLWRDIVEQARIIRSLPTNERRNARRHFLGAVVFNEVDAGVRHVPVSEVIDGQQRLLTLQVALAALRDVTSPLQNEFLAAKLKRLTENEGPYPAENERYKAWPTNAYRDDFQNIISAASATKIRTLYPLLRIRRKTRPRPLLIQAYLYFYEATARYLRGDEFQESDSDQERSELDEFTHQIMLSLGESIAPDPRPLIMDRAELLLEAVIGYPLPFDKIAQSRK